MRRRDFITAGIVAPFVPAVPVAQAQQPRRLGVLLPLIAGDPEARGRVAALMKGLAAQNWREGTNLRIDWRWAGSDATLFDLYAAELVALTPDVLLALGSAAVVALHRQTSKIPIVFTDVTDPVGQHFVASMARPGGNITGFSDYDPPMAGKWVEMLTWIAPPVAGAAVIFNPASATFADLMLQPIENAARMIGVAVRTLPVREDSDLETTMAALARETRTGLIVLPDFFSLTHRKALVELAARYRLPAIYWNRSFVTDGGLMSYGTHNNDLIRRSADYIARLLKDARPGDLPVQGPTKFELVFNLKAAAALGVAVTPSRLAAADEVTE